MHRTLLGAIGSMLLAAACFAQYGNPSQGQSANKAAKPDFAITASYIEACSCDMFCPCYMNTRSTMHGNAQYCRANLVLHVDKGYYKNTQLTGAKVWLSTDLGSDWSTGKDSWLVITFDPKLTDAQKAGLGDIMGQLYPFKWEKVATDTGDFTWRVDTKTGVAQAKMANGNGEVTLERVSGDNANNANREVVMHNLKYWMAQSNDGFRMWKTKHEYYTGHDQTIDYSGTNGFLITIHFEGQAKPAAAD